MAKVLIVCGTIEGQTEKISDFIGKILAAKGHHFEIVSGSIAPVGSVLDTYDAVVVGSSVHMGKFNKDLQSWVAENSKRIQKKPSAFFSVCLGILEKNERTQAEEMKIVDRFFETTHWQPTVHAVFAGALKYSKYNWLKKQLMKRIASKAGGGTDTSKDYEYTNWNDVRAFAEQITDLLGSVFSRAFAKPS